MLVENPVELLVDFEEEPDIEIEQFVSYNHKTYVEFDSRLKKEYFKINTRLETGSLWLDNLCVHIRNCDSLPYYGRVIEDRANE